MCIALGDGVVVAIESIKFCCYPNVVLPSSHSWLKLVLVLAYLLVEVLLLLVILVSFDVILPYL